MQIICKKTACNSNARLKDAFRPAPLRCMRILQIALSALSCLFYCANAETATPQLDPIDFLLSRHETKTSHESDIPNTTPQHAEHSSPKTAAVQMPKNLSPLMTYAMTPLNFVAQLTDKSQQNSSIITTNPGIDTLRRLWQAEITVPDRPDDDKTRDLLLRAIEQIRSIQLDASGQAPEPIIVVEPLQPDPNEPSRPSPAVQPQVQQPPDIEPQTEPKTPPQTPPQTKPQPVLPYEAVTEQTLQLLKDLLQDPNQAQDPFELAEILFASNHLKEASILYQEAFKRKSADQAEHAGDRAWILFQIGNCLRDHDPETATKAYTRLIQEYPASAWTDLAKARNELIRWYRKDKPQMLIEENKR